MADALEMGAVSAAAEMDCGPDAFAVVRRRAADASVDDLLSSDGYIFVAPENLASTSGEMLEFFHRSYYSAFTCTDGDDRSLLVGRPYALAVAAGSDGSSAARQMGRICTGWRLRPVASEALVVQNGLPQDAKAIALPKHLPSEAAARCADLGGLLAATVLL